jgi:hypothetical protein
MVGWEYGSNWFSCAFSVFAIVVMAINIKICGWLHRNHFDKSKQVCNAVVIFFIAIPGLVHLLCIFCGLMLALVEGWSADAGVFHFKLAFGLVAYSPYGNLSVQDTFGKIIAMLMFGATWGWFNLIMGFAGGILLIQNVAGGISPNAPFFYSCVLSLIIPLGLMVFAVPWAIIFSIAEDIDLFDAWLSTTSVVFLGGGASGFPVNKMSDAAQALLNMLGIWAVGFQGGVIGFCAAHPACIKLLNGLQVMEDDTEDTTPTTPAPPVDAQEFEKLQNENADLRKRIADLEAEIAPSKKGNTANSALDCI